MHRIIIFCSMVMHDERITKIRFTLLLLWNKINALTHSKTRVGELQCVYFSGEPALFILRKRKNAISPKRYLDVA